MMMFEWFWVLLMCLLSGGIGWALRSIVAERQQWRDEEKWMD
jgi:hypothetical protein